jgi:soluble lytic murein transglycosylase
VLAFVLQWAIGASNATELESRPKTFAVRQSSPLVSAPFARVALKSRDANSLTELERLARQSVAGTTDSGLTWFSLGYARLKNGEPVLAVTALELASQHPSGIEDYVSLHLGSAYLQAGQPEAAIQTLREFSHSHADSSLKRDAQQAMGNALVIAGKYREAIGLFESMRNPSRLEVELALGRAWIKAGDTSRGVRILQDLVYGSPLSWQADIAKRELESNRTLWRVLEPSLESRRRRVEKLMVGRRWSEAALDLRPLLNSVPEEDRMAVRLYLVLALRRSGSLSEAREEFGRLPKSRVNSLEVQRLGLAADLARANSDESRLLAAIEDLRTLAPASNELEDSLFAAANYYLLRSDWRKSGDHFRELEQRFPRSQRAPYAHWKAAWMDFRQGRHAAAKRAFEIHLQRYPHSREYVSALYWRARLAQLDGDKKQALVLFTKLANSFPGSFYGQHALIRLEDLGTTVPKPRRTVSTKSTGLGSVIDDKNAHIRKSRLLERAGLAELAVIELKAGVREAPARSVALEVARIYRDAGMHHSALQVLKREFPVDLGADSWPPEAWEILYPRPFWSDLNKAATRHELPPSLVLGLIRQESEFNFRAVSRANAIGLMQLLPSTATDASSKLGLGKVGVDELKRPELNLQLGIYHFKQVLDEFGGQKEYALAAYNAGSSRVRQWLAAGSYSGIDEFVESIPFTETRQYVQAIIRNEHMYQSIYRSSNRSPEGLGF